MKARIEVDHRLRSGTMRTTVLYVDDSDLRKMRPADAQAALRILGETIEHIAKAAGLTDEDARAWLLAELVERMADEEAYEREAHRRGLLAL